MFEQLKQLFGFRSRTLEAAEGYRLWARDYPDHPATPLMQLEEKAVRRLLPSPESLQTIDLACGSGRYLKLLREARAARVVGLDLSSEMLNRARGHTRDLLAADLQSLPLTDEAFDLAVCGLAVGHLASLGKFLTEVARILRPGGALVYSDLHPFAAYLGWTRSIPGSNNDIHYHTHLYADHQHACRAAGLEIEEILEPRISFEHEFQGWPAALVLRARRRE